MATFARMRDLIAGVDRTGLNCVDEAVKRLADAVPAAGERGWLLISLGSPAEVTGRRFRMISLTGEGESIEAERPDVEIWCSDDTLWRMLSGSYSPVEAFREGVLRVRGEEKVAKRVLRHLAGPDGSVDCI